jgi:DNA polymerase
LEGVMMLAGDMEIIRRALRQRAEADRILGAREWPVARELLMPRKATVATPRGAADHPARQAAPAAPLAPAAAVASASVTSPIAAMLTDAQADVSPVELAERVTALDLLNNEHVRGCTKCGLCETRTNTVFADGSPAARIAFVGEAPGFDEDRTGTPFVGKAGQLLTRMIERGMGLKRGDVYICNVLKCRPPDNRNPAPDEIAACSPYLLEQLRTVRPEVIVALGAPAAQTLLRTRETIGRLRGRFHNFFVSGAPVGGEEPIPLMPTYHPAYLLRSPGEKVKTWEDLKMVLARLNLPTPG